MSVEMVNTLDIQEYKVDSIDEMDEGMKRQGDNDTGEDHVVIGEQQLEGTISVQPLTWVDLWWQWSN